MPWFRLKLLKSHAIFGLLICFLGCAGVFWVHEAGVTQPAEFAVYDYYIQHQPQISVREDRILLVTISERDIQQLGSWPLNDGLLAQLLKNLLVHNPRVIGVDIFRNIEVPPGSDALKELFSRNIPVITIMKFKDKTSPGVPAPYMVKDKTCVGFSDALVDSGGITRRGLLFMDDGQVCCSSLPLLLAVAYLKKEGIGSRPDPANPEHMQFGKTTFVPLESDAGEYVDMDASGYQFLLNFAGAKAGFASISLSEALAGNFADEAVRDRIVIVGATAESLKDLFFIPVTKSFEEGQKIWGLELHATTVSQLLHSAIDGQKPMEFLSHRMKLGWIVLWGLLGYAIGLKVHSFRKFAFFLFIFPAGLATFTFLLFQRGLWVPVISPLLAFLVSADAFRLYLLSAERHQKALLMRLFESCVSISP